MVTTRTRGLLNFDPSYKFSAKECLPSKGIETDLPNCSFYIFVTDIIEILRELDKYMVLGGLTDDGNTIINNSPQRSEDRSPPKCVISIVVNEKS